MSRDGVTMARILEAVKVGEKVTTSEICRRIYPDEDQASGSWRSRKIYVAAVLRREADASGAWMVAGVSQHTGREYTWERLI